MSGRSQSGGKNKSWFKQVLMEFKTTLKNETHKPHFSSMGNCIRGGKGHPNHLFGNGVNVIQIKLSS